MSLTKIHILSRVQNELMPHLINQLRRWRHIPTSNLFYDEKLAETPNSLSALLCVRNNALNSLFKRLVFTDHSL